MWRATIRSSFDLGTNKATIKLCPPTQHLDRRGEEVEGAGGGGSRSWIFHFLSTNDFCPFSTSITLVSNRCFFSMEYQFTEFSRPTPNCTPSFFSEFVAFLINFFVCFIQTFPSCFHILCGEFTENDPLASEMARAICGDRAGLDRWDDVDVLVRSKMKN